MSLSFSVSPLTTHYVLVDYDNLARNVVQGAGCKMTPDDCPRIISFILKSLDEQSTFFAAAKQLECISVLLYNGWYKENNKTRLAEDIVKAISSDDCYKIYTLSSKKKVRIDIKPSYGLLSLNQKPFYGTVRRYASNLNIDYRYSPCCEFSRDMVSGIKHYVATRVCKECGSAMRNVIFSEGQKLVDTMLACDLHWLARDKSNCVALVTSDDDLVPPIFQQSQETENVYHVLTKEESSHCFENFYLPIKPEHYKLVYLTIGA